MINIAKGEYWNRCHSCGAPDCYIITIRNNINPNGGTNIQLCNECLKSFMKKIKESLAMDENEAVAVFIASGDIYKCSCCGQGFFDTANYCHHCGHRLKCGDGE